MTGLRASLLSDQGAFYADAQPSKFRAGLFHIGTGSYDIPAAHVGAKGVHEQGSRRRRVPLLVPRHRGLVPDRAPRPDRCPRARRRPGRAAPQELHQAGAVPVPLGHRLPLRLRELPRGDADRAREARLRGAAARAGRGARGGAAARDRHRVVHRGGRRRQRQGVRHRRAEDVRLGGAARSPDRQGDPQARCQVAGPGA